MQDTLPADALVEAAQPFSQASFVGEGVPEDGVNVAPLGRGAEDFFLGGIRAGAWYYCGGSDGSSRKQARIGGQHA